MLRIREIAAHIAKLTGTLCESALSPFPFVRGERRVAEAIEFLTGHLARLGRSFLAAFMRPLRTSECLLDQAPDRLRPRRSRRRLRLDPGVDGLQFVRRHFKHYALGTRGFNLCCEVDRTIAARGGGSVTECRPGFAFWFLHLSPPGLSRK